MPHSRTTPITSVCHPTNDPKKPYLIQVLLIECEVCQSLQQIQVVGHHIPAVIAALQEAQRLYPELCHAITEEVPKEGLPHLMWPPTKPGVM